MGFVIRPVDEQARPDLLCDYCEKPIRDWHQANVHFDWPDEAIQTPRIVHKRCCRLDAQSEKAFGWMPLEDYLGWLLWNNGWGKKKRARRNSLRDEIVVEVRRSR